MEDDLKIFKVEYLSNHLFDPTQLLNLSLGDLDLYPVLTKSTLKIAWNEDDLQWKMTSKYLKWNISATTDWIFLKF